MRVHRRQRVVQQHHISARVAGASQSHALFLTAAEVDTALPDLRVIAYARQPFALITMRFWSRCKTAWNIVYYNDALAASW